MGRTKQGGSILGYVLVGGVLIALLLGGAYAFRTYWSKAPEVAKVPVTTAPAPTNNDTKKDEPKSSDKPAPATPQPAPKTTPAPATPAPTAPRATTPSTGQLPQTGPVDTLLSVVAIASLVLSLGVYLQSRRLSSL